MKDLAILYTSPPELETKACQAHRAGSSIHNFSAIYISLVLGHTKNSSGFSLFIVAIQMRLSIHTHFYHESPKPMCVKFPAISIFRCILWVKRSCAFSLDYFREVLRSAVSWITMLDCIWSALKYCEPFNCTALHLSQYIYCLIKYFLHFKCCILLRYQRPAGLLAMNDLGLQAFLQVFLDIVLLCLSSQHHSGLTMSALLSFFWPGCDNPKPIFY